MSIILRLNLLIRRGKFEYLKRQMGSSILFFNSPTISVMTKDSRQMRAQRVSAHRCHGDNENNTVAMATTREKLGEDGSR